MEVTLSRSQTRPVVVSAKKMGAVFIMRSMPEDNLNKHKKIKTGWGWEFHGRVNSSGDIPRYTRSAKPVLSPQAYNTKYEAAQDFLKWALINL